MIRHRCAACGRPINRTDRFFEASDGTLCQDCKASLAHAGPRAGQAEWPCPPPLAVLPQLGFRCHR